MTDIKSEITMFSTLRKPQRHEAYEIDVEGSTGWKFYVERYKWSDKNKKMLRNWLEALQKDTGTGIAFNKGDLDVEKGVYISDKIINVGKSNLERTVYYPPEITHNSSYFLSRNRGKHVMRTAIYPDSDEILANIGRSKQPMMIAGSFELSGTPSALIPIATEIFYSFNKSQLDANFSNWEKKRDDKVLLSMFRQAVNAEKHPKEKTKNLIEKYNQNYKPNPNEDTIWIQVKSKKYALALFRRVIDDLNWPVSIGINGKKMNPEPLVKMHIQIKPDIDNRFVLKPPL